MKIMEKDLLTDSIGEFIGTFILVFFGCGAVAVSVLFSAHNGLFQVAAIWGIAVSLAIYATRHISCAHLNPAVSLAMVAANRMDKRKLLPYLAGQFAGAFAAAAVLYFLFNNSIAQFELMNHIARGTPESVSTARIFAGFYPNPDNIKMADVTLMNAFFAEACGTFALLFFIFSLTEGCNVGRPDDTLTPLFIGSALSLIISIVAPMTMAGLNPARDLSPRLFAYLAGWKDAALPADAWGSLIVYMAGPVFGAVVAALVFRAVLEPLMLQKKNHAQCRCAEVPKTDQDRIA
jgi:glycerol uptake facilitator protein